MKKIDIIRPGSINAIIGPVGTLKRMLEDRIYFENRGYDITIFTDESLRVGGQKLPPNDQQVRTTFNKTTVKWKIRHAIGSFIRNKARRYNLFAIYLMKRDEKKVKRLVNYYISQNEFADIVQFHSHLEAYFYLKNKPNVKTKTVMFLHTDGDPNKMFLQYFPKLQNTRYFRKYMKNFDWTVKNIDQICFIAKIGQQNFLKYYPERTLSNTSVIINGINDYNNDQLAVIDDIKKSLISKFKYRLCCTGTINNRKGHRFIIEALHQLSKQQLEQIHVDFLGDGAERQNLEVMVRDFGLMDNVTFYGIVPNVDVYKHLAENNIYILMSKNEGLPISIIEALRASMMIISTKVSGIPELIDEGYNGFLLNPNASELVDCLSKLDQYDIEEMGSHSRIRFENEFTFNRMKEEFCNMYDYLFK